MYAEDYSAEPLSKQDHWASKVKKRGLHGRQYIGSFIRAPSWGGRGKHLGGRAASRALYALAIEVDWCAYELAPDPVPTRTAITCTACGTPPSTRWLDLWA